MFRDRLCATTFWNFITLLKKKNTSRNKPVPDFFYRIKKWPPRKKNGQVIITKFKKKGFQGKKTVSVVFDLIGKKASREKNQ